VIENTESHTGRPETIDRGSMQLAIEKRQVDERRLVTLLSVMQKVAGGDFSVRAKKEADDVIGMLAIGLNMMIDDVVDITEKRREAEVEAARIEVEISRAGEILSAYKSLEATNKELKESRAELERSVVALRRSNEELEHFAYVASHDLQEPLRMVGSYMQLIQKRYTDKLDQDAHEFIGYAMDGAVRMKALIEDLLKYSRIGTQGQAFKRVECGPVVDRALENLGMAIEESGAQVTRASLPAVMADEIQFIQLFQNLIDNAIKYRGESPPVIHVSVGREGGEWRFAVQDNGIGVDSKYHDRIFVIFQRLHGREKYSGTGIGLANCKKIVERHGGRIWIESELGKGSTLFFTTPAISPEEVNAIHTSGLSL